MSTAVAGTTSTNSVLMEIVKYVRVRLDGSMTLHMQADKQQVPHRVTHHDRIGTTWASVINKCMNYDALLVAFSSNSWVALTCIG